MKFNRRLSMLAISAAIALSGTSTFADNALDRVMKNGVLKVATDANWAPQSFLNDNNEMDGFDVAVAREIATRLGVEVEFVTPSWDIITAGNWSGRWDMSVGSMTPTVSRAEVLSFPEVYYYTPASIAVHADSPYQNVGDLNGEVVGATTASTFELYLQKDLTIDAEGVPSFEYLVTPGELRSYKDGTAALDDLRLGDGVRINAMVGSLPAILAAIESGYPVRVLGEPVFYEPLAVAIDRGDAEFNNKVAGIVRKMKEDGTLKALSQKWYGIDYTTPVE
ncbi:transporter substrate-binding domain-containing protein [Amylibacter sp.]|nr:transporter substrate-binding domain-containing protein [Amylibacter sp.]MDA9926615.1 transporter substrate-binding domain-containing protein [Amylibacter sp.]MDB0032934.1 transporter substrate-binding domain-containing protein [Amylibacter sp.]MDB4221753.1 transporter substrate-binding domain-containing protein [Amylibacter sp.]MDC1252711.1 transporter substrate-binding domain-containing protein [Amylibacter sp.]|tara:strand:+ start:287 stop:1123 length:837 start_codon:yes stop_codon:yes gene_type:complete